MQDRARNLALAVSSRFFSKERDSQETHFKASPVKYNNSCIINQNNLVVKLISLVYHKSFFYLTGRAQRYCEGSNPASPVKYKNSCIFNQIELVVKLISFVYRKSFFLFNGASVTILRINLIDFTKNINIIIYGFVQ